MKRLFCVFAILTVLVFAPKVALAVDFICNDGAEATYYCTYLTTYAGQEIYSVDVGPQGQGLLMYNSAHSTVTIKVFPSDYWISYSQEGVWQGDGSPIYNANAWGGLFSRYLWLGELKAEGAGDANSNQK
jgi:hypothetical protein